MAIDFTKRAEQNPNDPDAIVSVRPSSTPAWVNPSDWSGFTTNPSEKTGKQEVRYARVLLNDGRVVRAILDDKSQPISPIGDPIETDPDQQRTFTQRQSGATRQQDQAERKKTRTYTGTDPATGKPAMVTEYESGPPSYDEIKPPTGSNDWHPEGTPDGQGGFDNSRPIMVRTVNGQRETRQPTAKELEDWNLAAQMTRNPGGKTDAQIAAETAKNSTVEEPLKGYPGWTVRKTTKDGQTKTVYINPDGQEAPSPEPSAAQQEAEKNAPKPVQVGGQWGYWDTKTDPKNPKFVPIEGAPADAQKPVQVEGQWGVWQPGKDGVPEWKPVEGPKQPNVDLPELRMEAGRVSQEAIDVWNDLNAQVRRNEITKQQAIDAFAPVHAAAQSRLTEINQIVNTQRGIFQDQVNQRQQDMSDVASRRTAATAAANNASEFLTSVAGKPGAGNADFAGASMLPILQAQLAQQQMGANKEVPQVTLGPAAASANALPLPGLPSPSAPMATPGAATSELATPQEAAAARLTQSAINPVFRPTPTSTPGSTPLGETATGDLPMPSEEMARRPLGQPQSSSSASSAPSPGDAVAALLQGISKLYDTGGGGAQASTLGETMNRAPIEAYNPSGLLKRIRKSGADDPIWNAVADETEKRNGLFDPMSLLAV